MAPKAITTDEVEPSGLTMHVSLYNVVRSAAVNHGFTVSDADSLMRVPEHHDLPSGYVIPDFMTDGSGVAGHVRDGPDAFNLTLRESQDGEAKTRDKSHFTAVAVREDWSFADVAAHVVESGQFEVAVREVSEKCRDDVNPADVVTYAVATYLKGVAAEKLLTATDDFSKAGVSNDQAGDDVYVTDGSAGAQELRQVKSVTYDEQVDGYVYYMFAPDGTMWYGSDYKAVISAVAGESDRVGDTRKSGNDIPKTVIGRTHTSYKCNDRPHVEYEGATYRYLVW